MKTRLLRSALCATSAALLVTAGGVTSFARLAHAETPTQEKAEKAPTLSGEYFDDTVITTKVKAAFVQDDTVSALRISVTSNNGIVQLSGFANSPLEADRAAMVARQVPGVKQVKNDILVKQPAE